MAKTNFESINLGHFPATIGGHPVIAEKHPEELGFTEDTNWIKTPEGPVICLPEPVLIGAHEFRVYFVFEEHGLAGLSFELQPMNRFDKALAKKQDKIITDLLFEQIGRPDEDTGRSWGFYTEFGVAVHFPYTGRGENCIAKAGSISIGAWETRTRDNLQMLESLYEEENRKDNRNKKINGFNNSKNNSSMSMDDIIRMPWEDKDIFNPRVKVKENTAAKKINLAGLKYLEGTGCKKDYAEAFRCFRKAADSGDSDAMKNLAGMYMKGLGIDQDYRKGIYWMDRAAFTGNEAAMEEMGDLYADGTIIQQDMELAFNWYSLATAKGNQSAGIKLSDMYRNGICTLQDPELADQIYRMATDPDGADGMRVLAGVFPFGSCGEGVRVWDPDSLL